jgi:hypothetical protein
MALSLLKDLVSSSYVKLTPKANFALAYYN